MRFPTGLVEAKQRNTALQFEREASPLSISWHADIALKASQALGAEAKSKAKHKWCPWPGSNQHSLRNSILSRARLPIPPQGPRDSGYHAVPAAVNATALWR